MTYKNEIFAYPINGFRALITRKWQRSGSPFFFYQNWFINEFARKIKAKIPEFHSIRDFFVRCRRTYILNKTIIKAIYIFSSIFVI